MQVTLPGPRGRLRLRALAFVAATVWMVGGPFYTQILHGRPPAFAWRMFGSRGLDIVEARFERVPRDGPREPVQRAPMSAPRSTRRIMGEGGLRQAVAELCTRLGPGTDLRVHARLAVADGNGWRVLDDGSRNACPGGR
jgi:hypothetical protein